jgi:arylsulfatase A-like enzyme
MVRWPGHVNPDSESGALISQVDLLSSLATLTGRKTLPDDAAPDSMNVLPALLGNSRSGRQRLVEHADALSLIEGDWKLIEPSNRPKMNKNTNTELGNDPQPQLYNLASDPGEKRDVAAQHPERVAAMTRTLQKIRSEARSRP